MVDHQNREKLAELLMEFGGNKITLSGFRSNLAGFSRLLTTDGVIPDVTVAASARSKSWNHSLEQRLEIARWVHFLLSDREYEWPIGVFDFPLFITLLDPPTLGFASRWYHAARLVPRLR